MFHNNVIKDMALDTFEMSSFDTDAHDFWRFVKCC